MKEKLYNFAWYGAAMVSVILIAAHIGTDMKLFGGYVLNLSIAYFLIWSFFALLGKLIPVRQPVKHKD